MRATCGLGPALGVVVSAALLVSGCAPSPSPGPGPGVDGGVDAQGDGALSVCATTGYLADAVENIAPEAEVTTMVGPGGDPHTYQPSTRDIETIQNADMVRRQQHRDRARVFSTTEFQDACRKSEHCCGRL